MHITFFNTPDTQNVINKTLQQMSSRIEGNWKKSTDLLNPTILVYAEQLTHGANYLLFEDGYSAEWYYITGKRNVLGGDIELQLSKDLVQTYKSVLLNDTVGTVTSATSGNPYVDNGTFLCEAREEVEQVDFPDGFLDRGEYILIVAGGGALND